MRAATLTRTALLQGLINSRNDTAVHFVLLKRHTMIRRLLFVKVQPVKVFFYKFFLQRAIAGLVTFFQECKLYWWFIYVGCKRKAYPLKEMKIFFGEYNSMIIHRLSYTLFIHYFIYTQPPLS